MTIDKSFDVFALANEVSRESRNGTLTQDLLSNGHTLYGMNPEFPDLLEQVTPDKRVSLGQFKFGQFHPQVCLLHEVR